LRILDTIVEMLSLRTRGRWRPHIDADTHYD